MDLSDCPNHATPKGTRMLVRDTCPCKQLRGDVVTMLYVNKRTLMVVADAASGSMDFRARDLKVLNQGGKE